MPGATSRNQTFPHQAAHEICRRGTVDAGRVNETNLIGALAFSDNNKDRELARGETGIGKCRRKRLIGRLLRPVQQM